MISCSSCWLISRSDGFNSVKDSSDWYKLITHLIEIIIKRTSSKECFFHRAHKDNLMEIFCLTLFCGKLSIYVITFNTDCNLMFTIHVKHDFFCRGTEDSAGGAPRIANWHRINGVNVSLLADTTSFMFPHSVPTQEP